VRDGLPEEDVMHFEWHGIVYDIEKMGQLQIEAEPRRLIVWTLDRRFVFKVEQTAHGPAVERIPEDQVLTLASLYRIPGLLP
jgi:hypothetical protein